MKSIWKCWKCFIIRIISLLTNETHLALSLFQLLHYYITYTVHHSRWMWNEIKTFHLVEMFHFAMNGFRISNRMLFICVFFFFFFNLKTISKPRESCKTKIFRKINQAASTITINKITVHFFNSNNVISHLWIHNRVASCISRWKLSQ